MSEQDRNRKSKVGLFRYERIADLLQLEPGSRALRERLRERAQQEFDIPGTRRRRVSESTLRRWMAIYRERGLEGLIPKDRSDRGQRRVLSQEVADLLVGIKQENRKLPVRRVIERARRQGPVPLEVRLATATVYRLLRDHGLMQSEESGQGGKDLRRFGYAAAGELWQADMLHGPRVRCGERGRRLRKTYYIGLLDDATRVIPNARFRFNETYEVFLPVFKGALLKRGKPGKLFVDNGSAFRCRHLRTLCAALGIHLVHGRPYHSEGRGKLERYHRTLRDQLLRPLREPERMDLEELNRRLGQWLENEYHRTPHRGLGADLTPLDAWAKTGAGVRPAGSPQLLDELCRLRYTRKVSKDRVVQFRTHAYEVDGGLTGRKVTLLVDPAPAGLATPLDRVANSRLRRVPNIPPRIASGPKRAAPPDPKPAPAPLRLSDLATENPEDES